MVKRNTLFNLFTSTFLNILVWAAMWGLIQSIIDEFLPNAVNPISFYFALTVLSFILVHRKHLL